MCKRYAYQKERNILYYYPVCYYIPYPTYNELYRNFYIYDPYREGFLSSDLRQPKDPSYIPQSTYASTGSIFNVYNNCPSKWIYVWLKNIPQGQPTEFWINISQLDDKSVSGRRIYYVQGRKHEDFTSIDIANITQATCYNPELDKPTSTDQGDCTVTGGKGKQLADPQHVDLGIMKLRLEIHECEIAIRSTILGVSGNSYKLTRTKNRVEFPYTSSVASRVVYAVYVENKEVWAEAQPQTRSFGIPQGWRPWRNQGNPVRIRLGPFPGLKI